MSLRKEGQQPPSRSTIRGQDAYEDGYRIESMNQLAQPLFRSVGPEIDAFLVPDAAAGDSKRQGAFERE
ncbi:MAG TPA: hypothetical protein VGI46_16545 [Candidatus Acidoferrum sp.]